MDYQTLEGLRQKLLGERLSLVRRRRQTLADENELLAEREPDWEDAAALETAASFLDGLSERERHALERIDSTLARIARGTYEECAVCRGTIEDARLRALPDTDRCAGCAAAH
jgi:RNA polymerase-binding transcription factor DksA